MFGQVEASLLWHDGEEEWIITKKPFVTLWADKAIATCKPEFTPEALGYHLIRREPHIVCSLYARFPVWPLLWFWEALTYQFWMFLKANRDIGAIHFKTPAGVVFRWRDLRLGHGPGRR